MWDEEQELDMLQEQIARRKEDRSLLERLLRQEETLRRETESCAGQLKSEERDVEKLEKLTLSSILASLRGSRDADMERELREAAAARLRLQEAERQLAEIREEIWDVRRRIKESRGCEAAYQALLEKKENVLRQRDPALAERFAMLEARERELLSRSKELEEAVRAGEQALFQLEGASGQLENAESCGTWDVFGGGLVFDMMKYSSLDDAQRQIGEAAVALRRYRAELEDVARTMEIGVLPDGFTRTADIWFDNIFSDLAVLDQIRQVQEQLLTLRSGIEGIQRELEQEQEDTREALRALRTEREELVRKA
jgi:DNA repair exonuclease SbcCD ATPase subunit